MTGAAPRSPLGMKMYFHDKICENLRNPRIKCIFTINHKSQILLTIDDHGHRLAAAEAE